MANVNGDRSDRLESLVSEIAAATRVNQQQIDAAFVAIERLANNQVQLVQTVNTVLERQDRILNSINAELERRGRVLNYLLRSDRGMGEQNNP